MLSQLINDAEHKSRLAACAEVARAALQAAREAQQLAEVVRAAGAVAARQVREFTAALRRPERSTHTARQVAAHLWPHSISKHSKRGDA